MSGSGVAAGVARAWFRAALLWLALGLFAGLTYGLQFHPKLSEVLIPPNPVHSAGRLRMTHAGMMLYGFLLSGALGAMYAAWARRDRGGGAEAVLEGGEQPEWKQQEKSDASGGVFSRVVAWVGFWGTLAALLAGQYAILKGQAQGIVWGEMPLAADAALAVFLVMAFAPALSGLRRGGRSGSEGSVSEVAWVWLAVGATGLLVSHIGMNLIAPGRVAASGAAQAALQGGLMGAGLLVLYGGVVLLFCSEEMGVDLRPFEGLYRWGGVIAGVTALAVGAQAYGPAEMGGGIAKSGALVFALVVAFLFGELSMRLRNVWTGKLTPQHVWMLNGAIATVVFGLHLAIFSADGAREALRGTDWMIAVHHLVFLQAMGSWAFGALNAWWPRVRGRETMAAPALSWMHFGLTALGGWAMVFVLALAGAGQALSGADESGWAEAQAWSEPLWMARLVAGLAIAVAQLFLIANVVLTRPAGKAVSSAVGERTETGEMNRKIGIALPVIFFVVFAGAVAAIMFRDLRYQGGGEERPLAVLPQAEALMAPLEFYDLAERNYPAAFARHYGEAGAESFRAAWQIGREVYVREGCFHCHTIQVGGETIGVQLADEASAVELESGGLANGEALNGSDIAEDTGEDQTSATARRELRAALLPPLGQRQVGPDLTESPRRSNDWHAAHLFKPRSVIRSSMMPAYPWLFEAVEDYVEPGKEALGLIVFLQTLNGGLDLKEAE